MAREKELHGAKLENDPSAKKIAEDLLFENPRITDSEISNRLGALGFIITPPSVGSWKKNYFLPSREKIVKESKKINVVDQPIKEEPDAKIKKLDLAQELVDTLDLIKSRIEVIKATIEVDKNKPNPILNTKNEELLRDYIGSLVSTNEKLSKYATDSTPKEIIQDIMKNVVEQVLTCFPPVEGNKKQIERFKTNLATLEKHFENKYVLGFKTIKK